MYIELKENASVYIWKRDLHGAKVFLSSLKYHNIIIFYKNYIQQNIM